MALQETGQGSRPPVAAADLDPARRPFSLGGTGCTKRSAAAGFPEDAVVEILSRLPAKSLFRFKCVSKAWCELIADRFRYRKLPQTLEGFFYGCVDDFSSEGCRDLSSADSDESGSEDSDESGSEDSDEGGSGDTNEGGSAGGDGRGGEDGGECGSKDENLPQHIHGHFINLSGISVPLVDPLFSSLRKQPGIRSLTFLDSSNGLLLFGHTQDSDLCDTRSYIVYNPATEHWVPVPSSGFKLIPISKSDERQDEDSDDDYWDSWVLTSCVSTHLIFDPVASSHFQLIEFGDNPYVAAVYIYSSETGKWDRMSGRMQWEKAAEWDLRKTIKSMRGSTILNKMLHLIVSPTYIGPELIAAINGKGETCRITAWPGNRGFPIFVGQSKGLLHCLTVSGHPDGKSCHMTTELSIWVLKDYDAEEWELKHTVSFLELFGKQSCQFGSDYNVATLHPEYNLIFFVQHWDYKLVSYDMDCKELHALCTVGCDYGLIAPYVPYFSETPVLSKKAQSKKALCNCFQLGYICNNLDTSATIRSCIFLVLGCAHSHVFSTMNTGSLLFPCMYKLTSYDSCLNNCSLLPNL